MNRILPNILAFITRKPRYKPEVEWSATSMVYNIFRLYELIFWRRRGIRPEISCQCDEYGVVKYKFHSFEALCVGIEVLIRNLFKLPKFRLVKVELPIFAYAFSGGGVAQKQPYLFALAYDNVVTGQTKGFGTTLTFSLTITGSNPFIFVETASQTDSVSGVTYNSVSLTQREKKSVTNGTGYFYTLDNPSTGANNVVITTADEASVGAAISYSGTGGYDSSISTIDAGTALSSTLNVLTSDSWVVFGVVSRNGGDCTAGTNVTERGTGNGQTFFGDSNGTVASGNYNQTATGDGTNNYMSGQVSVKTYVASGPANLKSYNTNVKANIKSIDTNLIANVKSLDTNV